MFSSNTSSIPNSLIEQGFLPAIFRVCDKETLQSASLVNRQWLAAVLEPVVQKALGQIEAAYTSLAGQLQSKNCKKLSTELLEKAEQVQQELKEHGPTNCSAFLAYSLIKKHIKLARQNLKQQVGLAAKFLSEEELNRLEQTMLKIETAQHYKWPLFKECFEGKPPSLLYSYRAIQIAKRLEGLEPNTDDYRLCQGMISIGEALDPAIHQIELSQLAELLLALISNVTAEPKVGLEPLKGTFTFFVGNLPMQFLKSKVPLIWSWQKQGIFDFDLVGPIQLQFRRLEEKSIERMVPQGFKNLQLQAHALNLLGDSFYIPAIETARLIEHDDNRKKGLENVIYKAMRQQGYFWLQARALCSESANTAYASSVTFFEALSKEKRYGDIFLFLEYLPPLLRKKVLEEFLAPHWAHLQRQDVLEMLKAMLEEETCVKKFKGEHVGLSKVLPSLDQKEQTALSDLSAPEKDVENIQGLLQERKMTELYQEFLDATSSPKIRTYILFYTVLTSLKFRPYLRDFVNFMQKSMPNWLATSEDLPHRTSFLLKLFEGLKVQQSPFAEEVMQAAIEASCSHFLLIEGSTDVELGYDHFFKKMASPSYQPILWELAARLDAIAPDWRERASIEKREEIFLALDKASEKQETEVSWILKDTILETEQQTNLLLFHKYVTMIKKGEHIKCTKLVKELENLSSSKNLRDEIYTMLFQELFNQQKRGEIVKLIEALDDRQIDLDQRIEENSQLLKQLEEIYAESFS
ncbi:MAG: hypothetical protein K0S07_40 [Chlamydiales bacterium]|jgi:hypothetical protein|nr:hypothetical protein [Chlamydiales bacterium]